MEKNLKVAICCIARLENDYIREYVEYYKDLGVDNIFLYDNNYDGEDDFNDVISDYISEGFVRLKNYRNRRNCQQKAYQECYNNCKNLYDWIGFFDVDEFVTLPKYKDIKEYLSQDIFNKYNIIGLNWHTYGYSGQIEKKEGKVVDRFTKPIEPVLFRKKGMLFPHNMHLKVFIRCNACGRINWLSSTPHMPSNNTKCCDSRGNEISNISPFYANIDYNYAYIRHYTTKSLEEFLIKTKRGYPDANADYFKTHNIYDDFVAMNGEDEAAKEYYLEWKKKQI